MGPTKAVDFIVHAIQRGQVPLLWGPPGVGKSDAVAAAAQRLKVELRTLIGVLLDPVDLRGVPSVADGETRWNVPEFLPRSGSGMLFLDEIGQAAPAVQAAMMQLTLTRRLGEYTLPEGWAVVAASNRAEDRAGATRLLTPLASRMIHLDVEASATEWLTWAETAHIDVRIKAYISAFPGKVFDFDPKRDTRAFACPRSWAKLSCLLDGCSPELQTPMVIGTMGEGAGTEFLAYLESWGELPPLKDILAAPAKAPMPEKVSAKWANAGRCALVCGEVDPAQLEALATYMARMPVEFASLAFRDGVIAARKAKPQRNLLAAAAAKAWCREHAALLK